MRDEMNAVERRLDAWGASERVGAGGGEDFVRVVGEVRRSRQTARSVMGVAVVAVVTAVLWVMLPGGSGGVPGATGEEIADRSGDVVMLGSGSAWTVAALMRRAESWEVGGGELLPEGWSMGWASKPPF